MWITGKVYSYIGWPKVQTMSIERVRRSNQSNAIEHDRTVEIRLSNAIESQSNGQILGNYSIGSIEIRLRSIKILRSIAFDLARFDHDRLRFDCVAFNWDSIAFDISRGCQSNAIEFDWRSNRSNSIELDRSDWSNRSNSIELIDRTIELIDRTIEINQSLKKM